MRERKALRHFKTCNQSVIAAWDARAHATTELEARCNAALAPFGAKPWFTREPFKLYGVTFGDGHRPDPRIWTPRPGNVYAPRYAPAEDTTDETEATRTALLAVWHPLTATRVSVDRIDAQLALSSYRQFIQHNAGCVLNLFRHAGWIYIQANTEHVARAVAIEATEYRAADYVQRQAAAAAKQRARETANV